MAAESTPWILVSVGLFLVILVMAGLLWYFGREVSTIRREIFRVKEQPPPVLPPPPPVEPAPGGRSSRGRVDLEAPPSDWPELDGLPGGPREVFVPPPPQEARPQVVMMYPLRVRILKVEGPVTRPVYCVCQIRGKPLSKTTTRVANETANPRWDHEASMVDFCQGDSLCFQVYDQDSARPDELLGEAILPCDRFLDRALFEEALPLTKARPGGSVAQGPWQCPSCTFENTASARICSVCETERPKVAATPTGASSALSVRVQVTTAVWERTSIPFFTTRWTALDSAARAPFMGEQAMRNDWDGEVGFRFKTRTDVVVGALGRQTLMGVLRDTALVTLWSDETQGEVASALVGPSSSFEGGYAFSTLQQPVLLDANKEFRISQQCFPGMADLWFDGCAEPSQLSRQSAVRHLEFLGSVYHGGRAFPSLVDREHSEYRRVGMLNLKLMGEDPAAEAERFRQNVTQLALPRAGGAQGPPAPDANEDTMQIRLVCMSPAPKEQQSA